MSQIQAPNGYTPQGQQLQSTQDILSQLTGQIGNYNQTVAAEPGQIADTTTSAINQQGIPGAATQYDQNYQNFAHQVAINEMQQHNAQAQGMQGSLVQPGVTLPQGGPQFMTAINPNVATTNMQSDTSGQLQLLKGLADYIQSGYSNVHNAVQSEQDLYKTNIGGQKDIILGMLQGQQESPYQQQEMSLEQRKQALAEWQAGYDPTNTTIDPADKALAMDVFDLTKNWDDVPANKQNTIRVLLKQMGTTPEQLKKDYLAQNKANLTQSKTEWKPTSFNILNKLSGKDDVLQNQLTGEKIPLEPDGTVYLTNPDTGKAYPFTPGTDNFIKAIDAGYVATKKG
jgi:hypothetical protein